MPVELMPPGSPGLGDSPSPGRLSRGARVGWVALALTVAYVVVGGGGYAGIDLPLLRLLNLSVIVVGLFAWVLLARRRPEWRPRSAIWPVLLIPIVVLALATFTSPFPRLGLDYLAWTLLLVALYLFLVRILAVPYAQARIGWLLAGLGILLSVTYIALVVGHWLEWWDLLGRAGPPMLRPAYTRMLIGGPTIVAPVLVLLAVGGAGGIGLSTRRRRVVVGALALATLTAVFLSGTRGAWLGLAGAMAVTGVGVYLAHRDELHRAARDRRVRVGAAVAIAVTAVGTLAFVPALLDRLSLAADGGRTYYAATALRMFVDSPLFGQGPGNWAARRMIFSEAVDPDISVAHPHNIYLLTLAETGLLGLLAGAAALVVVAWLVIGALRDHDRARQRWGFAATFVLVYLGTNALVDSFANLPVVIVLAAVPFAVLDASSRYSIGEQWLHLRARTRARIHATVTVLVLASAALAAIALVRIESLAIEHQRAVAAIDRGDWAAAMAPARAAVAGDPDMIPYRVTLGLGAAATGDWSTAASAFEAAAEADGLPQSWLNLALSLHQSGAPTDDVVHVLERASRFGDDPSVSIALVDLYTRLGLANEAAEEAADLLAAYPSLAADGLWTEESRLAAIFPAALRTAMERSPGHWELALMAGDAESARDLVDSDGDDLAGLVIDAWAGDTGSLAQLQADARLQPHDIGTVSWAARASAKAGDGDAASDLRRIIEFTSEGTRRVGFESRIAPAGSAPSSQALPVDHVYGADGYRRVTPDRLLAAGLPTVVDVDLARTDGPP
jgi:O-antigen ligase